MIKFKLIAVVFLILGSNFAFGQSGDTVNRRKAQFGLKAGTNYSNVYNSKRKSFELIQSSDSLAALLFASQSLNSWVFSLK